MSTETTPPLSWSHTLKSVGPRGLTTDRVATDAERDRIKAELDVLAVDSFHATYTITPQSGGCFGMAGSFTAKVTQACVVTLEPVDQNIDDAIDVTFCPPNKLPEVTAAERTVLDEPDFEPLVGDTIDAGRVLYELLSTALDPYPRKSETEFSWKDPKAGPEDAQVLKPFAALSKLKTSD